MTMHDWQQNLIYLVIGAVVSLLNGFFVAANGNSVRPLNRGHLPGSPLP